MAETKVHTGAMLAVYPTDPSQLSSPTGDAPADLHLTLAYLGEAEDLSENAVEFLTGELLDQVLAASYGPIEARISGAGTLGDKGAIVAVVESEKVQELRDLVASQLEVSPYAFPDPYPTFIPHVTIGYASDTDSEATRRALFEHAVSLIGRELTFGSIKVVAAGDVMAESIFVDEGGIPMPLDDDVEEELEELLAEQPVSASAFDWYRHVRQDRLGLTAARTRKFNPLLHPRGRDGRFIRKFGWIKWLANSGNWTRGQVIDIDGNTGLLKVRGSDNAVSSVSPKIAITTRAEKARMRLPNLDTGPDSRWKQVGGQGGSNKGGVFEVENASRIQGRLPFNAVENALESRTGKDALRGTKNGQKYPDSDSHALLQDVDGDIWRLDSEELENIYTDEFFEDDFDGDSIDGVSPRMKKAQDIIDQGGQWVGVDNTSSGPRQRAVQDVAGQIWQMHVETADDGDRFYVKKPASESHARNEVLANRLYELAGVPAPDVYLSEDATEVGSKMLDEVLPLSSATEAQLARIREDFAVDAWLANWDVVGLADDNIVISKGIPTRIDSGGALLYRATGPSKGNMFGPEVGELESLKNPYINPNSSAIFSKVSDDELVSGAERVAAIHPDEIARAVDDLGMPESVADTLIARRADLIKKVAIEDPHAGKIPEKTQSDVDQATADEILKSAFTISPDDPDISSVSPTDSPLENDPDDVGDSASVVKAILPESVTPDQPSSDAGTADGDTDAPDTPQAPLDADLPSDVTDPVGDVEGADDLTPSSTWKTADDVFKHMPTVNSDVVVEESILWQDFINAGDEYAEELDEYFYGQPVLIEFSSSKPPLVGVLDNSGDDKFFVTSGLNESRVQQVGDGWSAEELQNAVLHKLDASYESMHGVGSIDVAGGLYNGDIELNGSKIGTYKWNNWPGNIKHGYRATIAPEYTLTGQPVVTPYFSSKSALNDYVVARVWPAAFTPTVSKPKTDGSELAKNLEAKQYAKSIAENAPGPLLLSDGNPVAVGTKVKSTTDGYTGEIISWPNQEKHKGLVYVKGDDGTKKYRKLSKLKLDDTTPAPEATLEAASEKPAYVSPYAHLKTADGKTPALGQKVKAGKAGKEVEGTLVKVNPKNGWVYIQGADGTKHPPKTVGTMHVLDESGVGLPLAAQAAMPQAKKSSKKPEAKTPGNKIAYPGPDGATITQDPAMVEKYLSGHSSRTLTKDGYAPYTGMIVRDSKGNAGIVTQVEPTYGSMPNYVTVAFDDPYKGVVKKKRSTKTLTADHGAMLTTADGSPLVAISEIDFPEGPGIYFSPLKDLPNGTIVYKHPTSDAERFVAVTQTGKVISFKGNFASVDDTIAATWMPNMKPVAVIDSGSENSLHLSVVKNSRTYITTLSSKIGDKNKSYGALVHGDVTSSVESPAFGADLPPASALPSTIKLADTTSLGNKFPAPKDAPPADGPAGPGLPQVTGTLPDLHSHPDLLVSAKAKTVLGAATEALVKNDSTAAGDGITYGVGDADHVEDMLFRFQIIRGSDGKDYLESRFRLREEPAEDLADRLLINSAGVTGDWVALGEVSPSELVEGDMISVRLGSSGTYKPGNNSTPVNATVAEVSNAVAISSGGFPVHRVVFITSSGDLAEMDLEDRGTGSIKTYQWDPNAAPKNTSTNFVLREEAVNEGWAGKHGSIKSEWKSGWTAKPDETGAASSELDHVNPKGTILANGGGTFSRYLDDGTSVTVRVAHRDESSTDHRSARRSNIAGEVKVRVPIEDELGDELLEEALGRAYEVVGLSPEDQGPPSGEQIALFALNKVVTNFSKKYDYRGAPVTSLQDPRVNKVFDQMTTELGLKVTLDDVLIHTTGAGAMRPVWSKRVARAMTERQGNKSFSHGGAGDYIPEILGGSLSGLLSSDERFSLGLMFEGQSSVTDLVIGSGDRVFIRARQDNNPIAHVGIVLHPTTVNSRMDIYANSSDQYGERSSTNTHMTFQGTSTGNERMVKRRIEPEDIAFAVVEDKKTREKVLDQLRDRNVTHVGTRAIEDIVVARDKYQSNFVDGPEWQAAEDSLNQGAVPVTSLSPTNPGSLTISSAPSSGTSQVTPPATPPAPDPSGQFPGGDASSEPGFLM